MYLEVVDPIEQGVYIVVDPIERIHSVILLGSVRGRGSILLTGK